MREKYIKERYIKGERMAEILTKEKLNECLYKYYKEKYGESETDVWYEQPAANVWVFRRRDKFISLKCHILNGTVTEYIEEA